MAVTQKELKVIEKVVGDFCRLRSPAELRDKLRLGYTIKNHDGLISESRPNWRDPSIWTDAPIAKLRYVRSSDEWRVYWLRASGKWLLYEPNSKSTTLLAMVRAVDFDSHGCFFS